MKIGGFTQHTFCSYCGTPFRDFAWPRACGHCNRVTYANPLPVAVALIPVGLASGTHGLLAIRRGIEPHRGKLALPGGFMEVGETWETAAVREVLEETGIAIDATRMRYVESAPTPHGQVLIFGLAPEIGPVELERFTPSAEASELSILTAASERLAFPLHDAAARRWLTRTQD